MESNPQLSGSGPYGGEVSDNCREAVRADALRNRAALVAAARQVFGERGLDAPLDEIARRAGVGNATLYRRFPTREALISAVFVERVAEYARAADRAIGEADPWTGFEQYVRYVLHVQASDRGLADLLARDVHDPHCEDDGELDRLRAHAYEGFVQLVERAQQSGALRSDFVPQDMVLLLMANAGLVHRTADAAPTSWARLAAFLLDGLRSEAATEAPPAPSEEEVVAAMHGLPGFDR
jgi:AcrR family transcriptional regulator